MTVLKPPAAIDDFARRPRLRRGFARGWDVWLRRWLDDLESAVTPQGGRFRHPRPTDPGVIRQEIAWDAFPKAITQWYRNDTQPDEERWRVSEILRPRPYGKTPDGDPVWVDERQQDEYCEWFVRRGAAGRIEQVDFTSEGPEYWLFLAHGTEVLYRDFDGPPPKFRCKGDLGLVVELYREYVDPAVSEADLVWPHDVHTRHPYTREWRLGHKAGEYNPYNKWNTTDGAMHLTHRSNSLSAEIALGAEATILRSNASGPVTDLDELICCSGYGNPNRSSDPSIGAKVNAFALAGYAVSIADPIGLYISELDGDAFAGPAGEDVADAWVPDRGEGHQILRAHFGPSAASGLPVERILADRRPIRFGAQIADAIQMILVGEVGDQVAPSASQPCVAKCCAHPDGRPVKAIIDATEACASVDWPARAPHTGAAGPAGMAAAAVRLDDRAFVAAANRRAG